MGVEDCFSLSPKADVRLILHRKSIVRILYRTLDVSIREGKKKKLHPSPFSPTKYDTVPDLRCPNRLNPLLLHSSLL